MDFFLKCTDIAALPNDDGIEEFLHPDIVTVHF
jgi:hypothetical protein